MKKFLIILMLIISVSQIQSQTWDTLGYTGISNRDLWFISEDTGYVGGWNRIAHSFNGGLSWDTTWFQSITGTFQAVQFPAKDTGYAFMPGSTGPDPTGHIFKTTDAGMNWTLLNIPFGCKAWSGYFVNAQIGFTGSADGYIFRTADGGGTWTQITTPSNSNVVCFWFSDINHGHAASNYGKILNTSDGGLTWSMVQTSCTEFISDICFPTLNTGYFSGYTSTLYKTTDGGLTWFPLTAPPSNAIQRISFPSADTGFIVGGNSGGAYATTDGGATWVTLYSGPNVYTAHAINNNTCFFGFSGIQGLVAKATLSTPTPCLPLGITFTTQAQVDSFAINYPNCPEILGNVTISGGNSITNLNGLSQVGSIGGFLDISGNHRLKNLNGLNALHSIGGMLKITANDSLNSLSSLIGLKTINDSLMINNNNQLPGLSGLDSIHPASIAYLEILNNTMLSQCVIHSVCHYLLSPNAIANIASNSGGCNSQNLITMACSLSGNETISDEINIYPNPANATLYISLDIPAKEVILNMYNSCGQKVRQTKMNGQKTSSLDVNGLANGLYMLHIQIGERILCRKIVIQQD